MNFFEFNDRDAKKMDFLNDFRDIEEKFKKLNNFTSLGNYTNIEVHCEYGEYMYRSYIYGNDEWLIMYSNQNMQRDVLIIKVFKRSGIDITDNPWIHQMNVPLTEILKVDGIKVVSIDYCHLYPESEVLFIVLRSFQLLHVIRIDAHVNIITDNISFPHTSTFYAHTDIAVDLIVSSNTKSLIIFDQSTTSKNPYCPSISDLQSVLSLRLISGVHSLISFWISELIYIQGYINRFPLHFLHNGVPVLHYLSFLHIHQSVLLNIIGSYCCTERTLHSNSNMFLEHLSNMVNGYINDAINAILAWVSLNEENNVCPEVINKMFDMLCDFSRVFRDIVLNSRLTLSVYQHLSVKEYVKKTVTAEKLVHDYDLESLRLMNDTKIVYECLMKKRIAALQIYSLESSGKCTSEDEIIRQSENVILDNLDTYDWGGLQDLVSDLGYKPSETLTVLCTQTKVKRIRDYLFYHLDLGQQQRGYLSVKEFVDNIEEMYTVNSVDVTNTSFYTLICVNDTTNHCHVSQSHIRAFVDRLDKSRCRTLKEALIKPICNKADSSTYQLINVNLEFFLELLKQSKDGDDSLPIYKEVELCLMDGDYRKILMKSKKADYNDQQSLLTWISKWRKDIPLFVSYVVASCDVDLIFAVISSNFCSDNILKENMIDQLTMVMCCRDSNKYTDVDRDIAQEVMMYILRLYPQSLITRLEYMFSENLPKAKDILLHISETMSIHLLCSSRCCPLRTKALKESALLCKINWMHIDRVILDSQDNEFPIVLYYLLNNLRLSSTQICNHSNNSIRKAALLHSAVLNRSPIDNFSCLISRNISVETGDALTLTYLDELAYAALLCGISYNDILDSSNPVIVSTRKVLSDYNYWDMLKRRLLRPPGYDNKSEDIEQYYEVNMYNFLYRSGTSLSLEHLFSNQSRNPFSKQKSGGNQVPTDISFVKERNLLEDPKESLNYIYYLSLGRPFQAFYCIEKEFGVYGKEGCVLVDIINEVVKNIYQIALSNIDNQLIIGGCFGILRLIGSSTELIRCYLTLIRWVIDWHVQVNDQCDLSGSTQSQQPAADIQRHYSEKTMALFKVCLSTNSTERKNCRRLIIRQLEEIFIWRLKNEYYTQISEVLSAWSLVLYFCQLHGAPSSAVILQYYAKMGQWLLFLCIAEIFGYSKDQVKEALNQFDDSSVRHHISYIISKVDDFTQITISSVEIESFPRHEQTTSDPMKRLNKSGTFGSSLTGDIYCRVSSITDSFSKEDGKSHKKYLLSSLRNSAKISLFELIFDCQLESHVRLDTKEDKHKAFNVRLNVRKLLAYSLALGHPFLSVFAYSADISKDDLLESSKVNRFKIYLNCLSCFLVASSPKRIQEGFWAKWGGEAKLDWSEDELMDLIICAIENKFVSAVSEAFTVLKDETFVFIGSFYSMISHSMECFNPVLRDLFLANFVNECTILCMNDSSFNSIKERKRSKSTKNSMLTFLNKLLGVSLKTALYVVEKSLGVRVLHGFLISLSDSTTGLIQSYVKTIFPFSETNVLLLSNVLSIYLDYFDTNDIFQCDQRFQNELIPVNTKSKEFIMFIEEFISDVLEKLTSSNDYTRRRLARNVLSIVEQINYLHSIQLPTNHDKWKDNESKLKTMTSIQADSYLTNRQSLVDLLSMALVGQVDKVDTIYLLQYDEKKDIKNYSNVQATECDLHGSPNSWRRIVIPEEWEDKILNLPNYTSEDNLDLVSHVNVLLNEKKWIGACNFMIEHNFSVKDAILILTSMKVACGKVDPSKLPAFIRDYCESQQVEMIVKDSVNKLPVRRMSVIMSSAASKLNLMLLSDNEINGNKSQRQTRLTDTCQQFLTKVTEVLIHGQELVEYICTMYCVANKMAESYISVAKGEVFDVLTKILVGTCRDKIDTADMYLGVVDIDPEKVCHFIAEVIVHVLRLEIQTYIGSTSIINSTSYHYSTSSTNRSKAEIRTPSFSLSPKDNVSFQSCISPCQGSGSRQSGNVITSYVSAISLHENTLKVAERCQLRSEWTTVPTIKTKKESRLIKAFTLQDILLLSPNSRKLGKILFVYYQRFSQEVFSCMEDAEFLVHLLIQCHNRFTEGGDTIGISNCLKAAKDLTRLLNSNGYFVLMAHLLCRIGRYGEMPYIFSHLIDNHEFEQLFRKDMDREGVIVPYIFDYLNRYHKNDYEKIEMVCVKYNCYYELAETKTKMASSYVERLKSHLGHKDTKDSAKMLTSSIINNFLEATKSYLKAGCYKKMEESFRKAQFFKLQQRWLEDPEKTFTVGPINKTGRSSAKVVLPETGLPYGVRIIDLTKEQALIFLKKIPHFYTAFLLNDQLRLSPDVWTELIVQHVFINGDETYLRHYVLYFGPYLSCNFIQLCLNRLERLSVKLSNKQCQNNLKIMLSFCGDVFFVKRISETYKLPN